MGQMTSLTSRLYWDTTGTHSRFVRRSNTFIVLFKEDWPVKLLIGPPIVKEDKNWLQKTTLRGQGLGHGMENDRFKKPFEEGI